MNIFSDALASYVPGCDDILSGSTGEWWDVSYGVAIVPTGVNVTPYWGCERGL